MVVRRMTVFAALMLTVSVSSSAQMGPRAKPINVNRAAVVRLIANWPDRPKLGAVQMMAKYGVPNEASSETLVWHNAGPFKRVTVLKLETPHDFPLPHVDYMEHTISYNVPQDKVGALIEFDASSTINRTIGELSARCDLEGHNILTLNLDHDIVMGKKTVQQARTAFGEIVTQDVLGQHPAYVEALQFQPHSMATAMFSDSPVIPGSPLRAAEAGAMAPGTAMNDAEILAMVIAVDLNEVNAGAQAGMKPVGQPVLAYAKMLHEGHGAHMVETMKLGQQMGATPVISARVEQVQKKGAGVLAKLVPMNGHAFEHAFMAAMIKGHGEVIAMIDGQLMPAARNEALKSHLSKTRSAVAEHLDKAKAVQRQLSR